MQLQPIGVIRTPHATKEDCPIQPAYAPESMGRVDVNPELSPGLQDLGTFSHIYLIYGFDRAGEVKLVRPTFLDDQEHGIFASRHPCRPNGIGMSIVELLERQGSSLLVRGVDMLDGTPLLDIKPYVPRFDCVDWASDGWFTGRQWRPKPAGRE